MTIKLSAILLAFILSATTHAQSIRILNWGDYINPDVISEFESLKGIKVEYVEFNNNEEFFEAFFNNENKFDVIFPASYLVKTLKDNNLIKKLDKSKFKHHKNFNHVVMNGLKHQDKKNQYTVPYMWGTTGIGYNAKALRKLGIHDSDISWSLIFDKALREKVASCGIGVLNERDEIFSAALSYLGYSINTKEKSELTAAGSLIKEAYKDFSYLHTNQYTDDLKDNKICIGVGYSGDILAQTEENSDINYIIPNQGATMWIDVMAIPTNSQSPELAYEFIDYLMSAKASAQNSNYAAYPSPMLDAQVHVEPEILADKVIYPDTVTLANLAMIAPSGKKVRRIKHRLWVKAICVQGKWCSVPIRSFF